MTVPDAEPVEQLGDLDVAIVSRLRPGNGPRVKVAVVDSRTGQTLIALDPAEAAAFGIVVKAKAARASAPAADPGEPRGEVTP